MDLNYNVWLSDNEWDDDNSYDSSLRKNAIMDQDNPVQIDPQQFDLQLLKKQNNNLRVIFWNARGYYSKFQYINNILKLNQIDVFAISEANITVSDNFVPLPIVGYNLFHDELYRIVIYTKDELQCRVIKEISTL